MKQEATRDDPKNIAEGLADASMWEEVNGANPPVLQGGELLWKGAGPWADPTELAGRIARALAQAPDDKPEELGEDPELGLSYLAGVDRLAQVAARGGEALVVARPAKLSRAFALVSGWLDRLARENAERQDDTHIAQAEAAALRDMPGRLENASLSIEGLSTRLRLTEEHAARLEAEIGLLRTALGAAESHLGAGTPCEVRDLVANACEDGAGVSGQVILVAALELVRELDPECYLRRRWSPLRRLVAALRTAGFEVSE